MMPLIDYMPLVEYKSHFLMILPQQAMDLKFYGGDLVL